MNAIVQNMKQFSIYIITGRGDCTASAIATISALRNPFYFNHYKSRNINPDP